MEEHLAIVKQCVIAYQALVEAFASGDPATQPLLDSVFNLETRAKDRRRDISAKIAEGAFFGGVREDILNLIHTNDNIADKAKDAARLLAITSQGDTNSLRLLSSQHMAGFQKNLLAAVEALESLIRALQGDKHEILAKVAVVEDFEEAADSEKDFLLRELLGSPSSLDPVLVIELRDFIFASDDIADNAENASDVVLVLVAKGYG